MRENRSYSSEGGAGMRPFRPLSPDGAALSRSFESLNNAESCGAIAIRIFGLRRPDAGNRIRGV
jgi:hypothetical protein